MSSFNLNSEQQIIYDANLEVNNISFKRVVNNITLSAIIATVEVMRIDLVALYTTTATSV